MNPEFEIADAFKRTDRSAGLTGRLSDRPPRRRAEAPPAPPEAEKAPQTPAQPVNEPEPTPPAEKPQQPAPRGRRRNSPRKPAADSDGRLVVALPIALRDRARAHASSRGETYLDVALAAVQDVHERLPQLVAARHAELTPPAPSGGLFEHQPRRKVTEATTQVTIRGLTGHDRAVLEELVDTVGAANLTELLTVALDAHLPQRPRSLR